MNNVAAINTVDIPGAAPTQLARYLELAKRACNPLQEGRGGTRCCAWARFSEYDLIDHDTRMEVVSSLSIAPDRHIKGLLEKAYN